MRGFGSSFVKTGTEQLKLLTGFLKGIRREKSSFSYVQFYQDAMRTKNKFSLNLVEK